MQNINASPRGGSILGVQSAYQEDLPVHHRKHKINSHKPKHPKMGRYYFLKFLSKKCGHRVTNIELMQLLGISYPTLVLKFGGKTNFQASNFKSSEIDTICLHFGLTVLEMLHWFHPELEGKIEFK